MGKTTIYIIIGAKWFDKVYGNTYYNSKVIVIEDNKVIKKFYTGFVYGYGSCYYSETVRELKTDSIDQLFVDGGSFYLNKREVKNGWF